MEDFAGIYVCRCIITDKRYVGSSKHVRRRIMFHQFMLSKFQNHNRYFQAAYNKYGEDSFEWSILERCASDVKLVEREQWWVDHFDSANRKKGYNLAYPVKQTASAPEMSRIFKAWWRDLSEEEKQTRNAKVSVTMQEMCADPQHRIKLTERSREYWSTPESRQRISDQHLKRWGKMTKEERRAYVTWVKPRETTKFLVVNGVEKPLKHWAKECGLRYSLMLVRFNNGLRFPEIFGPSYKYTVTEEFRIKHSLLESVPKPFHRNSQDPITGQWRKS